MPTPRPIPVLTPAQTARFWARVDKQEEGCWVWTGSLDSKGYGMFGLGQRQYRAHRVSLHLSGVDLGDYTDHVCRVRSCVNPDHLEVVTNQENLLRSPLTLASINARKTQCKWGHEFTPENTWPNPNGLGRWCGVCRIIQMRSQRKDPAERERVRDELRASCDTVLAQKALLDTYVTRTRRHHAALTDTA